MMFAFYSMKQLCLPFLSASLCCRYAALLLHLNTACSSFVLMEDDSYARPLLLDQTSFASAFLHAEASLFLTRSPYVKLFSTNRYYRFSTLDPHSYFVLGSIGVVIAIVLNAILAAVREMKGLPYSASHCALVSCVSIAVGVVCGVWISKPTLLPMPSGVIEWHDDCCSQAHLYAGGNSSVTRRLAEAVLDAVDRDEMYDVSLASFGHASQWPLAHKPSLFGHAGIASSRLKSTRTHFIEHIEE